MQKEKKVYVYKAKGMKKGEYNAQKFLISCMDFRFTDDITSYMGN